MNIEELERQLRSDGARDAAADDPLAELTRLIESFDAHEPPQSAVVDLAARRAAGVQPRAGAQTPAAPPPPAQGLRGTLAAEEDSQTPHAESEDFEALPIESDLASDEFEGDEASATPPARRRWLLRGVAAFAIGAAGFGYFFYSHGGLPGASKAPPTILAATTPAKVQPPTQDSVGASDDSASLLRKSPAALNTPAKIVGSVEQPVDVKAQLATQPQPPAPSNTADGLKVTRDVAGAVIAQAVPDAPPPTAAPPKSAEQAAPIQPPSVAAPVAVSAPPAVGQAPAVAQAPAANVAPAAVANPPAPQFPAPTKQHSVVIRPDGSLVTDAKPAAPAPAPAAPAPKGADGAGQVAPQSSTPKLDVASKAGQKSVARVISPKPDAPAAVATSAPLQLAPAAQAKANKPAPVAAPAPADATPPAPAPAAAAADTTPPNAVVQADGAKGAWAVQLAAPRSQAEADATVAKLQGQYSDALGGNALTVHKAEVNGETVYRVRAAGLDKATASDVCSKVHAAGGACFIAR